ncbi:aminoglycoside phosphotransferase family protein [Nesterenkonia ebinurensis]|uniref:aminoglycoside phosphotransferase family protein n=1 Tax=Nesterenkonia ebinurensis TaxID=2608252 RepID=UPI00168AD703|nr:aminoglycoside phosphotransferase family protein [Nesterenkonia ebinurensis]
MVTDEILVREGAGLHDRFGVERADQFGQALPALVGELTELWELSIEKFLDAGATSIVLAASDGSGAPAVLKISPDQAFLARQVEMLHHLAPTGRVPAILKSSPETGAVLLERVLPGDTVNSPNLAQPTVQDWAALLHDLHAATAEGVTDLLDDRCEEMFERIGQRQRNPAVRERVPDIVWEETVDLCRELLGSNAEKVVIHGDLHLGNVLASDEHGLVAIDPKLCLGDPCFDMVDFAMVEGGPAEIAFRAGQLAEAVGVDRSRMLAWSKVNAVITSISRLTFYGPEERSRDLLTFAALT